jgi:hypothetical protein
VVVWLERLIGQAPGVVFQPPPAVPAYRAAERHLDLLDGGDITVGSRTSAGRSVEFVRAGLVKPAERVCQRLSPRESLGELFG